MVAEVAMISSMGVEAAVGKPWPPFLRSRPTSLRPSLDRCTTQWNSKTKGLCGRPEEPHTVMIRPNRPVI